MDHTYKISEIVGSSAEGVDDAIRNGIGRAAKTLRGNQGSNDGLPEASGQRHQSGGAKGPPGDLELVGPRLDRTGPQQRVLDEPRCLAKGRAASRGPPHGRSTKPRLPRPHGAPHGARGQKPLPAGTGGRPVGTFKSRC